jgi:DNA-binding IclR family transcriptional regulator
MSSADRLMETLALFTPRHTTWTPERAAQTLGVSRASAYRYFALLTASGFLEPVSKRGYTLGPAIVELDRQIRLADPLVQSAADIMAGLAKSTGGMILLCRLYRDRVLCVHQERGAAVPAPPATAFAGRRGLRAVLRPRVRHAVERLGSNWRTVAFPSPKDPQTTSASRPSRSPTPTRSIRTACA